MSSTSVVYMFKATMGSGYVVVEGEWGEVVTGPGGWVKWIRNMRSEADCTLRNAALTTFFCFCFPVWCAHGRWCCVGGGAGAG